MLRACRWNAVVADAPLIKLGKRLATVDVRLWQDSEDRLIAQSTVGYALPQRPQTGEVAAFLRLE